MDFQVKERYEALCTGYWVLSYLLVPIVSMGLLFYVALFTTYSYLAFLYMCWAYYDKETPYKGGRK